MNKFYLTALLLCASPVFASSTYSTTATSQKPEEQKSFMERLKEVFNPSHKTESTTERITEGPTVGERISSAAQSAKVSAKEAAHETKEALTDRPETTIEGRTIGERASSAAESAKDTAKGWMGKVKRAFSSDSSTNKPYNTPMTETTTNRPYGQSRTGKTWSESWEDFKESLFGTKKPYSDTPAQ